MATRGDLGSEPAREVKGSTSSVERSVDLLAELLASPGPVRITDLARRTNLPKSTVHRILTVFVARGVALRVNGGYLAGPAFIRIADSTRPDRIQGSLMPILLELDERTRGAVGIAVLSHAHVVYSSALRDRHLPPPEPVPASLAAAGKLLMAFTPDLESRLSDASELTELITIRRRRFVCVRDGDRNEVEIAAPVFDRDGRILAAIRLVAPGAASDVDWLVAQVKHAALAATAVLARGPGSNGRVARGA